MITKTDRLVFALWREYDLAERDYLDSSLLSSGGPLRCRELCASLIEEINQLYGRRYLSGKESYRLQEKFLNLESKLDLHLGSLDYQALVEAYHQPHRYYHHLGHILRGLDELDLLKKSEEAQKIEHPELVESAWWYHDSIYDTRAKDNEKKSAELMERHVGQFFGMEKINYLRKLILATKKHSLPENIDQAYLIDIDLSPMADNFERFHRYGIDIRQEYHLVPSKEFLKRRKRFLQNVLERPTIYQTEHFRKHKEDAARENLLRELRELEENGLKE